MKVAVCQVPDIREDIESSLQWIEKLSGQAEGEGVDLICFPECFLQGYLTEKELAEKHAVDLASLAFKEICYRLSKFKLAIVFGLIESDGDDLYNSAVVINNGKLMGKYSKTHLLNGESFFKAGTSYPLFEVKGVKFGINICYDTQFPEVAAAVAKQGAQLILCPANNMMRLENAEKYKFLHHSKRIERVKETGIWLLSSDVTGERDGRISYGPTSAISPEGEVVVQVPLMEVGMVMVDI